MLKKLGDKSFELSSEMQKEIVGIYLAMEESEYSHIYDNNDFGFWKVNVIHPQYDEDGNVIKDKKGKPIIDKERVDSEIIPFSYAGGIDSYIEKEVHPYSPGAWVDEKKTRIGYEISFTKCFYKPEVVRPVSEVSSELLELENETRKLLDGILGGVSDETIS